MKRAAPLLLLLALPLVCQGSGTTVYRWKDANGVVHYSQTEPERIKAEIWVRKGKEPVPPVVEKPKTTEQLACEKAQLNDRLLAGDQRLSMDQDGDGTAEILDAEGRKKAKAQNDSQLAMFCTGN